MMEYKGKRLLYHITPKENVDSILKNGLIANEQNNVFLFEDYLVKWHNGKEVYVDEIIAANQLFLKEFALFFINADGLELIKDDVAELTAEFQFIHKGNIPKERLIGYQYGNIDNFTKIINSSLT